MVLTTNLPTSAKSLDPPRSNEKITTEWTKCIRKTNSVAFRTRQRHGPPSCGRDLGRMRGGTRIEQAQTGLLSDAVPLVQPRSLALRPQAQKSPVRVSPRPEKSRTVSNTVSHGWWRSWAKNLRRLAWRTVGLNALPKWKRTVHRPHVYFILWNGSW